MYGTTGRLEKGYRLMGAELDGEYTPVEAGLARPKVKSADFIGKEAYLAAREEEPVAVLCTLTVEDHTSPRDGIARYMTGGEPILTARRRAHRRRARAARRSSPRRARVRRSASSCCSPTSRREHAVVGTELRVCYMNEDYPVRVAVAGSHAAVRSRRRADEGLTADG